MLLAVSVTLSRPVSYFSSRAKLKGQNLDVEHVTVIALGGTRCKLNDVLTCTVFAPCDSELMIE